MKKNLYLTCITFILLGVTLSNVFAQGHFSIGFASGSGIQNKGFQSFDVSDWQYFGLGADLGEGRIHVPLGEQKVFGSTYGFYFMIEGETSENSSGVLYIPFTFKQGVSGFDIYPGFKFNVVSTDLFKIGITPRVGYSFRSINFGETQLIDGYNEPVVIATNDNDNRLNTVVGGERLKTVAHGVGFQIAAFGKFYLIDNICANVELGYGAASFTKFRLKTGDSRLKLDSPAIVKAGQTAEPANIEPKIRTKGLFFNIGVGIDF